MQPEQQREPLRSPLDYEALYERQLSVEDRVWLEWVRVDVGGSEYERLMESECERR